MLGFKYFYTAVSIFSRIETVHMIKKEQLNLRDQPIKNDQ